MRLDKFLKVSRIIKRRTVAKDYAENDRVMVNGKIAKPSTDVKVGDVISLRVGVRQSSYQILKLTENIKASDAKELYRIME
ncbi:MAG: RNA-binding S4 domain-containing protein [Syntrophomonadaceae bacterium]|nr:RNA-binding S4 domain-containing protein [Syntrophomonadaceae bacterium]